MSFDSWRERHPELLPFISLQANSRGPSFAKVFKSKRKGIHSRIVGTLSRFSTEIDAEVKTISEKMEKIRSDPMPALHPLHFDCGRNLHCRILYFTAREGHERCIRYYESCLAACALKRLQISQFLTLFVKDSIPEENVLVICDHFFVLARDRRVLTEIDRLCSFSRALESRLADFPIPTPMANFPAFFQKLIAKAIAMFDPEVGCFPPLKGEVKFARFVFQSKIGEKIDGFIQRSVDRDWSQFGEAVPFFCKTLVKDIQFHQEIESAVANLLYFRLLVNRIYETVPTFNAIPLDSSKLDQVRECPISLLHFPEQFLPTCRPEDASLTVFRAIPKFASGGAILATIDFLVDPIEILVVFRRMIDRVHALALAEDLGRPPTKMELQMILGFDELFTSMFAAFIASEAADLEAIAQIVNRLTPRQDLSSLLDYSLVCFQAVALEVDTVAERVSSL
jgi:hypothetical protein